MSDRTTKLLTIGALAAAGIICIFFPELIPEGLLLTDSIMEHIDNHDGFFSL